MNAPNGVYRATFTYPPSFVRSAVRKSPRGASSVDALKSSFIAAITFASSAVFTG